MNLRETIAAAMWNAEGSQGAIGGPNRWDGMKPDDIAFDMMDTYRLEADAAIAAFAEAVQQPEVLEAVGNVIGQIQTDDYRHWQDTGNEATERYYNDRRKTAKAAIAVMLHAIGADPEDCGCTTIDHGWHGNDGGIVDVDLCSRPGCPRAETEGKGSGH